MPFYAPQDAQKEQSTPVQQNDYEQSLSADLPYRNKVLHALDKAGDNAQELLDTIKHFEQKGDKEQLKAACLLIAESPYLFHASYKGGFDANEGDTPSLVLDCTSITKEQIVHNIEFKFGVRDKSDSDFPHYSWTDDVSDEQFIRGVLPYRGQTEGFSDEPLENYLFDEKKFDQLELGLSYEEFHSRIDDYSKKYGAATTPSEKHQVIEDLVFFINTEILYQKSGKLYAPRGPEDMDIVNVFKKKSGRCTDLCHASMYTLRALGLPALHDRVPLWPRTDDNHTWVTMPLSTGTISFDGGLKVESGEDKQEDYFSRRGYGRTNKHGGYGVVLRSNIDANIGYVDTMKNLLDEHGPEKIQEITSLPEYYYILGTNSTLCSTDYFEPKTLELEGFEASELYHLAVFNRGTFDAILPIKADENGNLRLEGIEAQDNLYQIVSISDSKTRGENIPFLLTDDGPKSFTGSDIKTKISYKQAYTEKRRALEPNQQYTLFASINGEWQPQSTIKTDENADAILELSPETLYHLRPTINTDQSGSINVDGLNPGEKYTLWKFEDGRWSREQTRPAGEDGKVDFDGLQKEGIYSVSHWYSPDIRPFSLTDDDKLKYH